MKQIDDWKFIAVMSVAVMVLSILNLGITLFRMM